MLIRSWRSVRSLLSMSSRRPRAMVPLEDHDRRFRRSGEDLVDDLLDAPGDVNGLVAITPDIDLRVRGEPLEPATIVEIKPIVSVADILPLLAEDERWMRTEDVRECQGGPWIFRNLGQPIEQEKRSVAGLREEIARLGQGQECPEGCSVDQETLKLGELVIGREVTVRVGQRRSARSRSRM